MKRSKERLTEIDNYINEHYLKEGGRVCADALGEKISYISSRVQLLKLVEKTKKPESVSKIAILEGKVTAKNHEIKELVDVIIKQKKENGELRIENTQLIHEKVKARLKHDKEKL